MQHAPVIKPICVPISVPYAFAPKVYDIRGTKHMMMLRTASLTLSFRRLPKVLLRCVWWVSCFCGGTSFRCMSIVSKLATYTIDLDLNAWQIDVLKPWNGSYCCELCFFFDGNSGTILQWIIVVFLGFAVDGQCLWGNIHVTHEGSFLHNGCSHGLSYSQRIVEMLDRFDTQQWGYQCCEFISCLGESPEPIPLGATPIEPAPYSVLRDNLHERRPHWSKYLCHLQPLKQTKSFDS